MAVNMKKFLSIIISITVCATSLALFAIWFESMPDDGHEKASSIDEPSVKFWLGCLRHTYDPANKEVCISVLRHLPDAYDRSGILSPDFREALSIFYNRNQTRVDIDICLWSERRCPTETMVLADRFVRESYEDESDIFDSNMIS